MNGKNDFYLTLLSNSSFDVFPENKTSSFTVNLPREITLDGSWSVALAEIHYPQTFNNVSAENEDNSIYFKFKSKEGDVYFRTHIEIPPGCYSSVREIVDALNYAMIRRTTGEIAPPLYLDVESSKVKVNKEALSVVAKACEAFAVKSKGLPFELLKVSFQGPIAPQLGFVPGV